MFFQKYVCSFTHSVLTLSTEYVSVLGRSFVYTGMKSPVFILFLKQGFTKLLRLNWNLSCGPGWPYNSQFSCLGLPRAEIIGVP